KSIQRHGVQLAASLAMAGFLACAKGEQTSQSADSTARNLTLAPTESTAAMKDVPAPANQPAKAAPEKKARPPKPAPAKPAAPAPNPNSTGKIELAVKTVSVRGKGYPIEASVVSMDTIMKGRGVTKADAAKVAGGAVAGAILGKIVGKNTKGAVIGGAAGAAAGAAAARASRDIDVVIPKGAAITVKLEKSLTV